MQPERQCHSFSSTLVQKHLVYTAGYQWWQGCFVRIIELWNRHNSYKINTGVTTRMHIVCNYVKHSGAMCARSAETQAESQEAYDQ